MSKDLQSDRELARRAAEGEPGSWKQIFDTTCDRLFALLCFLTGDRDEAKDLLQETYLQAWRRLRDYRGEAPLEVWLRAIAVRKAIDWKRRVLRRMKQTVPLFDGIATIPPPAHDEPSDAERASLQAALARLSPKQRASLILRELEERSFAEIASTLGCNESTARVHHTRARQRMQGFLARLVQAGSEGWEGQRT